MTNDQPPLRALAGFRAAARRLSFQAAAQDLHVTPSAISHQVAQLEAYLGAPVFLRKTRAVVLTPLGRKALRVAEHALEGLAQLRAGQSERKASLRVSSLPLFTQAWLLPRIGRFAEMHPDIAVTITTENRVADLNRNEADIGIRNLRAKPSGVVARKVMDIRGVPLCAPELLTKGPPLAKPADLARHTLIHISSRPDAWATWFRAQGAPETRGKASLSLDTVPSALEAAAQGLGVVLGMDPLVWQADVSKGLVRAMPAKLVAESSYYACTSQAGLLRQPVKAFLAWLLAEARVSR